MHDIIPTVDIEFFSSSHELLWLVRWLAPPVPPATRDMGWNLYQMSCVL